MNKNKIVFIICYTIACLSLGFIIGAINQTYEDIIIWQDLLEKTSNGSGFLENNGTVYRIMKYEEMRFP